MFLDPALRKLPQSTADIRCRWFEVITGIAFAAIALAVVDGTTAGSIVAAVVGAFWGAQAGVREQSPFCGR